MDIKHVPFRYDYVGSFLRPEELKKARKDFSQGKISREELTAAEDKAIVDLVAKQKAAGYKVICDGEFRRATWHLDFMWGFTGVGHKRTLTGIPFHGEAALIDDTYLTDKISVENHPFVAHYKFVKALEDENTVAKQTMPAPAQFLEQMLFPANKVNTVKFYPDAEKLAEDIAAGYRKVIKQLYDEGCRNIQFDDCTWGLCVDPSATLVLDTDEKGLEEIERLLLDVNNLAIEGKPDDLTVTTHVCRGNYHSTWASRGGYGKIAPLLFGRENVSAYYLEYDDERSGGFEPLKFVPEDKKVVLGLITTKRPELEDRDKIISRIYEASKFVPLDNLCLSPQCGFASCEIGNKLTEEEQWAKLELVKQIAQSVWKD
ncbi:MAG: 5-methyltetrahydropteroyltriglutamate--homocysteine S-methyltransferase [Candidatus Coproplasma sp.]